MNNLSISLGKRQLVDSIWKSTGIEGLETTFPSTKAILENIPVTTTRDEVFFVCNMKNAWQFLFDNIDYPLNLMYLRELNKITMDNLLYDPGNLRITPVSIGGTSWKPNLPTQRVIAEDLENILNQENKTDVALDLFCYITRSQMFLDGNKRLAQLVCNKVLMEYDIGILSIPYNEIIRFTDLLINFYETNDNTKLKTFLKEDCLIIANPERELQDNEIDDFER